MNPPSGSEKGRVGSDKNEDQGTRTSRLQGGQCVGCCLPPFSVVGPWAPWERFRQRVRGGFGFGLGPIKTIYRGCQIAGKKRGEVTAPLRHFASQKGGKGARGPIPRAAGGGSWVLGTVQDLMHQGQSWGQRLGGRHTPREEFTRNKGYIR